VETVIPALRARRPGGTVNAWSAGCATGEEAYTLALLLSRNLPGRRVRVLGTDISREALEVARAGTYPERALAPVPEALRRWGFEPSGPGAWRVADHVSRLVAFEQRNLAEAPYPRGFDLIWCRNVLIYFSPEARAQAVRRLADSLDDGGFLFVGYAESLRDVPNLERVRTPDAVLYRKRSGTTRARSTSSPGGALPGARAPGREPSSEIASAAGATATGAGADAVTVALRGRYEDAGRLAREVATALGRAGARVVVDLDGAEYLGEEAAAVLRRARSAARAAGLAFDLLAERPGTRRWLERYRLGGEDG
jgi:anti-anti-sigma regulatory factor